MNRLKLINKTNLQERWPDVEAEVERVVKKAVHGEFDTDDVRKLIQEGRAYGAYLSDSGVVQIVCIWEMIFYPKKTAANIMALGGRNMAEAWEENANDMKWIWRAQGADCVECSTSAAMASLLEKARFPAKPIYVHLRFDL